MYIIEVIPLVKGINLNTLSYFSGQKYKIGTLLKVPIRNQQRTALVVATKDVNQEKTNLRLADFSLKRLPKQSDTTTLPDYIIKTASKLTTDYPASVGLLLYSLLPPDIRSGKRLYNQAQSDKPSLLTTGKVRSPQLLTARSDERLRIYQNLIRSSLANKQSVLIITPTAYTATVLSKQLSKGISNRLITLSGYVAKKQLDSAYTKLQTDQSAKIIITSPTYAYLTRDDVATIIIEETASPYYVTKHKPYLDHRLALRYYAQITGKNLILADTVPPTEDEFKRQRGDYETYGESIKRIVFFAPLTIIFQKDKPRINTPFKLLSNDTLVRINKTLDLGGRVFLYAARRGLAPLVNCIDCGFIFRCPDSGIPYSLIRTEKNGQEQRWFVSTTSGRKIKAPDVCNHCGSWRLRERGLGSQYVYDDWKKINPDTATFLLDNTTGSTIKKAEKIASDFFNTPGSVLIGTQLALPFLHQMPDLSIITSLDAAKSIPSWRADEFMFRLILKLRERTRQEVVVQTRSTPDNLLLWSEHGEIEKFYNEEISLRQMLDYPPFCTFILLTWQGNKNVIKKQEADLRSIFTEENVQFYNSSSSFNHNIIRHALIKIKSNNNDRENKKENLMLKLKQLPPEIKIEINPNRIV